MTELFNVQLLERAGLATVALVSVWLNYKLSRDFSKTINNHISHFTEINQKLADAVDRLISVLDKKRKL